VKIASSPSTDNHCAHSLGIVRIEPLLFMIQLGSKLHICITKYTELASKLYCRPHQMLNQRNRCILLVIYERKKYQTTVSFQRTISHFVTVPISRIFAEEPPKMFLFNSKDIKV
jgi:hypothetical protein